MNNECSPIGASSGHGLEEVRATARKDRDCLAGGVVLVFEVLLDARRILVEALALGRLFGQRLSRAR